MIVSHHGQYEFGSPKLPMTLEAVALHQLDNLDAKMHSFPQLMLDDPNVDSSWTNFHASLGRKLYKGSAAPGAGRPRKTGSSPARPGGCADRLRGKGGQSHAAEHSFGTVPSPSPRRRRRGLAPSDRLIDNHA